MLYFDNYCTDAAFNLALEEYLMKTCPENECIFSLWQSKSAVLIGRYQNAMDQIHSEFVQKHGIAVVRRITGGGAVFQDLGNINYSFIRKGKNLNRDFLFMTGPIIEALSEFGVRAEFNSRNDITVNGFKISGNAVHVSGDTILHHGTLLLNSDFSTMERALKVGKKKLADKGIASVAGRVGNLADFFPHPITMEEFRRKLMGAIIRREPEAKPLRLLPEDRKETEALADSKYRTWDWNYGESPDYNRHYSQRLACGLVDIYIKENRRKTIENIRIFGDFFGEEDVRRLEDRLKGAGFTADSVGDRLRTADTAKYLPGVGAGDLIAMLFKESAEEIK